MQLKPKTFAKWVLLSLSILVSTSSFAFKNNLDKPVNGEEATDERIEEGSTLFGSNCASCHALDGKVVGPALGDVVSKYDGDYEWIVSWIKNNDKLRKSGDERALAIYDEYGGQAMNLFENLSDAQITSILMWIENGGDGDAPAATEGTAEEVAPVDEGVYMNVNWTLIALSVLIFVVLLLIIGILELVGNITGRQMLDWNNINAFMMILFVIAFFSLVIYEYAVHKQFLLPEASSIHGLELDKMMRMTFGATIPVFFITQFLLFYFSFKYRSKPGRKAYYYPHNNNLEYIWTFLPAVVLTILVLGGLKTWKKIVRTTPGEDVQKIEVFAYQFGWSARYAGEDGELGKADFNLISGTNPLGIANLEYAKGLVGELTQEISDIEARIEELGKEEAKLRSTLGGRVGADRKAHLRKIASYEDGDVLDDLEKTIRARHTQIDRIERSIEAAENSGFYNGAGDDDMIVQEIHIVKDKPISMNFRARDVIHSAYMPYFRAQMNVVPGLPTKFTFTPTKTTQEMRDIKKDQSWDYYLVCNKICGNAHFNMKIKIVVEDETSYNNWIGEQRGFFMAEEVEPMEVELEEEESEESTENNEEALAIN
ncbi:MAG: c-type cytochrome [Bacteroidia bacterium]